MRNPNLDYQHGLIDLWLVTLENEEGGVRFIGECTESVANYLKTLDQPVGITLVARPSQSVMRFIGNDVAGIGEPK